MVALYKQQLGDFIRRRREDLGLTQKQLADRAHVAESQTVSRWERGERAPQDLEAVAAALETTVAEILGQLEPLGQRERKAMNADNGRTQLDRVEALLQGLTGLVEGLAARDARVEEHLQQQNGLLSRQTRLIEDMTSALAEIRSVIAHQDEAAMKLAADGHAWADAALARYREVQLADSQSLAPAPKARAKSASRRG